MAVMGQLAGQNPQIGSKFDGLKPCPHRTVDDGGMILCGLIKTGDKEVSVNLCRGCPVPLINCQHLRAGMKKNNPTPITVRFATGRVEVWDDEAPTIKFKQAACAVKTMPIHSARDCTGCPLRLPHVLPQSAFQAARRERSIPAGEFASTLVPPPGLETQRSTSSGSMLGNGNDPARPGHDRSARGAVHRARHSPEEPGKLSQAKAVVPASRPGATQPSEPVSKIILFQQWLADQFNRKVPDTDSSPVPPGDDEVHEIVYSRAADSGHAATTRTIPEEASYERCVGWTD
jgi:hypothetical protein